MKADTSEATDEVNRKSEGGKLASNAYLVPYSDFRLRTSDLRPKSSKWREPSYLAKKGSTIRIDWKPKTPDQYAMYFKCTSKLVPTFRKIYGGLFKYEKNRAILFGLDDEIPEEKLKACIELALTYHSIKNELLP